MAGILNKKERFVDYQLTDIGKGILSDPMNNSDVFFYVSVSDRQSIYDKDFFSNAPIFEVSTDIGTITSVDSGNAEGSVSWGDSLFYNCVASGTTSTNSNGFDYYSADSNSSMSCVSSSFVVSSFVRRLISNSNLLLESNRVDNSSFNLIANGTRFYEPLDSEELYNFSKEISHDSNIKNEGYFSHPDISSNLINFRKLSPTGISGGREYSSNNSSISRNIRSGDRNFTSIKIEKSSLRGNTVLQLYNIFAKSSIDESDGNINFSRLTFIKVGDGVYVAGIFFNKKDLYSVDKKDLSPISLVRNYYFDVGNDRSDYPLPDDSDDGKEASSSWSGNDIFFMKIFTVEVIK